MTSLMFWPATMPTVRPPRISARNGCTLAQVISTTIRPMPSSAAATSCHPGATGSTTGCAASGTYDVIMRAPREGCWTYSLTMASMLWSTSTTTPFSSGASGSRVSNCDCSSDAGMKCPGRLAWRRVITSSVPWSSRNSVRGAWWRSWSRYLRFRAEQLITPPSSSRSASHSPIDSSHGCRSSSSSAWPAVILAMLAGGWKSSASANGTRSRWARAAPTVDFPDPDTPMTTTSGGGMALPDDSNLTAGSAAGPRLPLRWPRPQVLPHENSHFPHVATRGKWLFHWGPSESVRRGTVSGRARGRDRPRRALPLRACPRSGSRS